MKRVAFEPGLMSGQVVVFDPALNMPFNDWSTRHSTQGFTWRPGSVGFRALSNVFGVRVEVEETDEVAIRDDATRVIIVPYTVSASGQVMVGSLINQVEIWISPGEYALVFQAGRAGGSDMWCFVSFVRRKNVEPEIVRADSELQPGCPLLMRAEAAV